MNSKLVHFLEKLGLSDTEAKVYLGALKAGRSTVAQIAKSANVNRTTVYPVIHSLKAKGLISEEIVGFKKSYEAQPPETLNFILDLRKKELDEYMPEFLGLYKFPDTYNSVKYYEGEEAIKGAYEQLLNQVKKGDEYLVLSNTETWMKGDRFYEKFVERRAKLPITVRLLLQDSERAQYYKKYEKNYNFQVKILPDGTEVSTNMNVTPSQLLIHELNTPQTALTVRNKSIIQMHRQMFELIWDSA